MKRRAWLGVTLAAAVGWGAGTSFLQKFREESLAPFVPSPQAVVDKMLGMAGVKPGETVYDLGCGDGRILITAAQKFKARGVGVELSPELARRTHERIRELGLQDQIRIIEGNLMEVDLRPADVVALYLLTSSNQQLRPKLEASLKRGSRVVSHDFVIPGWQPSRVEKVAVSRRVHTIYLYEMPPKPR